MSERALMGWKEIAKVFNVSERTMKSKRDELVEVGAIFYLRVGRPPRRRVMAFMSTLRMWAILKGAKNNGEI